MLSLLFDSGFWYDLIFILLIGFIIFLCFKYPNSRVYVFSFLGIIFVGVTAYCGIQLNYYYTAEGGVWGYITGLIEGNKVTTTVESDTASFSLENIVLTENTDKSYSAVIYSNEKIRLDSNKTYGVYIDDEPCTQVSSSSNYVRAIYHYAFLDYDLDLILDDTLQFNFAFYANGVTFTLTTYGGQNAVNFWNTYFTRNNLIVEVRPIDYEKDNELSIGMENILNITFTEEDLNNYDEITKYFIAPSEGGRFVSLEICTYNKYSGEIYILTSCVSKFGEEYRYQIKCTVEPNLESLTQYELIEKLRSSNVETEVIYT